MHTGRKTVVLYISVNSNITEDDYCNVYVAASGQCADGFTCGVTDGEADCM